MEQLPDAGKAAVPAAPPHKTTTYRPADPVFAVLALLLGFLGFYFVLFTRFALSATVFSLLLLGFTLCYFRVSGIVPNRRAWMYLLLSALSGLGFFICDPVWLSFLNLAFFLLAYAYFVFCAAQTDQVSGLSPYAAGELTETVLLTPFIHLGALPGALATGSKKRGRTAALVALGLFLALPVTVFLLTLLMQADQAFEWAANSFFAWLPEIDAEIVASLVLGIPAALYLFGLLFGSALAERKPRITRERMDAAAASAKIAPMPLVTAALTPICLLYALYFLSQISYFLSAFQSTLPDGFSYAEYARRGFFELSFVAFVNLVLIGLTVLLTHIGAKKTVRGFSAGLSVFTLLLIASALSKMILYISIYGLTPLRVYTSAFMLALAAVFGLLLVKQLAPKFRVSGWIVRTVIAMFLLLVLSNPDGLIARYNVDRYLDGSLADADVEMLSTLSDAVLPHIARLAEEGASPASGEAQALLERRLTELDGESDWRNLTLPGLYARSTLK